MWFVILLFYILANYVETTETNYKNNRSIFLEKDIVSLSEVKMTKNSYPTKIEREEENKQK